VATLCSDAIRSKGYKILIRNRSGQLPDAAVPLKRVKDFAVYNRGELELAVGDRVRVTGNGKTVDRKHALNNGSTHEVRRIGKHGNIQLTNGMVVDRNYGHLDHGYVLTSHASQGKIVDRVVIVQTSRSYAATSAEQLYVSATRGRESLRIYTDDKDALRELALRFNERQTATELFPERDARQSYLYEKFCQLAEQIEREKHDARAVAGRRETLD